MTSQLMSLGPITVPLMRWQPDIVAASWSGFLLNYCTLLATSRAGFKLGWDSVLGRLSYDLRHWVAVLCSRRSILMQFECSGSTKMSPKRSRGGGGGSWPLREVEKDFSPAVVRPCDIIASSRWSSYSPCREHWEGRYPSTEPCNGSCAPCVVLWQ